MNKQIKTIHPTAEDHGLSGERGVITLLLLWATILFSMFYVIPNSIIRYVLLLIAICVTLHMTTLKTLVR